MSSSKVEDVLPEDKQEQQQPHLPLADPSAAAVEVSPELPPIIGDPNLSEFFNSIELSDIILIDQSSFSLNDPLIPERRYFCHKIILSSKSSFFRQMFRVPTIKECLLPAVTRISLESLLFSAGEEGFSMRIPSAALSQLHRRVDIVETALRFVYSDYDFSVLIGGGLTTHNCLEFFAYFSELKIASGVFLLEKFILQYFLTVENCIELIVFGLRFNNAAFIQSAVRLTAEKIHKLLKIDSSFYSRIMRLPIQGFEKILASSDLAVEQEDILLSLFHDYCQFQQDKTKAEEEKIKQQPVEAIEVVPSNSEEGDQPADVKQEKSSEKEQKPPSGQAAVVQGVQKEIEQAVEDAASVILNDSKIRQMLCSIRLGYVSHSVLTHFSEKPVFSGSRDVFFKAISLKLSQYEANKTSSDDYSMLNWEPRDSYFHKVNVLHPTVTATARNLSELTRPPSRQKTIPPVDSDRHQSEKFVPPAVSQTIQFKYSSDFDDNGLLYMLGSKFGKAEFGNPFYASEIMPFCSSLKIGRIEDLTARMSVNTISTENEKNSFIGFDLGDDRQFFPTCYTLRNRSSPSYALYNWLLEGSNDNTHWYEIDKRIHFSKDSKVNLMLEKEREILRKPTRTSTWGIDTSKLKATLKQTGINTLGFRVFRLTQLGANANHTHELSIGAIEFYGKAFGLNWQTTQQTPPLSS